MLLPSLAAAEPKLLDVALDASALGEVLDDGGGASAYTSPPVAAAAAFLVGFGAGHGMAESDDALLWLPIDVGTLAAALAIGVLADSGIVWALALTGLAAERTLQALSAYEAAKLAEPPPEKLPPRQRDDGDDRIDAALGPTLAFRW